MSNFDSSSGMQKWWELLAIQAGGTMCLPILCIGQLLCVQYGWKGALCAIFAGNSLLLIMGIAMSMLSTRSKLSTFGHVREVFGQFFQRGLGVLMLVAMLGWFAVQINLMTVTMFGTDPSIFPMLAMAGFITLFMYLGCQAMRNIALMSAPLLTIGMLCLLVGSPNTLGASMPFSWGWISGISLVIGAHIAVLVDLPTFFQHARSQKDGLICITFLYALTVPLVEAGGVWLAATSAENETLTLLQPGSGLLISSLFVLSGWSANNANLYSAVEAAFTMGLLRVRKRATLLLGSLGALLACMNPLGHIESLLEIIGVALGTMGAVMITQFLCSGEEKEQIKIVFYSQTLACVSYGVGVLFAALSAGELTTSVVLDACVSAAVVQMIGMYLLKQYQIRKIHVSFNR